MTTWLNINKYTSSLYIIYTNNLQNSSKLLTFLTYADDTTLFGNFCSFENKHCSISEGINKELNKINNLLKLNKLSLNISKTKFIIFHIIGRKFIVPTLKINNNPIDNVQFFNFLGIEFNEHLTWSNHISKIAFKISRTIGVINKLKILCLKIY